MRDKFFITNLLFRADTNEKSNMVPANDFPCVDHVTCGGGMPPITTHTNIKSLPSSSGPTRDWIGSPRSFRIFGVCGGTVKRHHWLSEFASVCVCEHR